MTTVVVLGAAGQLGQTMTARLAGDYRVVAASRADIDLTDYRALHDFVVGHRPNVIVNCAAYTNVDAAEGDPKAALAVNAFAPRTLARAAEDAGAVLVHYSTDFVFAGNAERPYTEDDLPEPQSVYGQSKLLGEWFAADWHQHYVLRVESLFGGPLAKSSVDKIANAVRAGAEAPVFFDRYVSPSRVDDVAEATVHLLRAGSPFGVYHCVNSGVATWLDVGREIARLLGRDDALLKPVSVKDVNLKAARPQYAALSNSRLAAAGFAMPPWQAAIAGYLHAAGAR
jgi:dTDP-4-dehydrorhamnose reductase